MAISLLIGALIVMLWRFPDALISRIVTKEIWVPIARRLMKVERRHILFAIMVIAVMLFAGEVIGILGPLDAGLIVLFDVATYVDILMVASLAVIGTRATAGWHMLVGRARRLARGAPRGQRARSRRTRPERKYPSANDDDDRPVWLGLAA